MVELPKNEYEEPLYNELKDTVIGIYTVQPKIFQNLKNDQAKALVGCVKLLLQTDKRDDIITILDGITKMTPDERHRLAQILQTTELSNITKTLGQVFRTRSQIQMLARKLMKWHKLTPEQEDEIVKFLCSESGSHDYSIHRNEAVEHLGLHVEKPTMDFYKVIKAVYDDISAELELESPYDPGILLNKQNPYHYAFRRGLIESLYNGTDVYISEGDLSMTKVGGGIGPMGPIPAQNQLQDSRIFEGWKHEA